MQEKLRERENRFAAERTEMMTRLHGEQERMEDARQQLEKEQQTMQASMRARLSTQSNETKQRKDRQRAEVEEIKAAAMAMRRELQQASGQRNRGKELDKRLIVFETKLEEAAAKSGAYAKKIRATEEKLGTANKMIASLKKATSSSQRSNSSTTSAIRMLTQERKEIDRLRSSIQRDLTRARQASSKKSSSSTRKLQQENAMLKDKLKAMENVLKGMKSKLAAANKSAPKGLALFRTAAKPKTPKTQTVTIMRDHGATTLHDDHGSSDHGSGGSHAPNDIGTLIINAEDGTVNIHIHGAAPTAGHHHTAPKTKTTIGFALDDVTNKSLLRAHDALPPSVKTSGNKKAKKPSKKKAKKPSKKKPSKNKKKKKKKDTKSSNKKINDEVQPLSA